MYLFVNASYALSELLLITELQSSSFSRELSFFTLLSFKNSPETNTFFAVLLRGEGVS